MPILLFVCAFLVSAAEIEAQGTERLQRAETSDRLCCQELSVD